MRNILVTGGTVFVSKYVAEYYAKKGDKVYVLNRNTRPQPENTILIEGDRKKPGDKLKAYRFDVVIDVTAYNGQDIIALCESLGEFGEYIMISSSAVYPENNAQPFTEEQPTGANIFWGKYGTDKIEAEAELRRRVPDAYILRPPYLYGPGNNVYRESFVFDCARAGRKFYLPRDGEMKLQFFHVEDLCRFMDVLLTQKPKERIFNVGNPESITVKEWVQMCYEVVGSECTMIPVHEELNQRDYFCFYDYEYALDVTGQRRWLPKTKDLKAGLTESYDWYRENEGEVRKKDFINFLIGYPFGTLYRRR